MTYQIEMWWCCSKCNTDNRGRYKNCTQCGKTKGREPFFDKEDLGPEDAITDPSLLKQALAGSDFECKFCGSHNRRDNGDCNECGALQGESREHITKWNDGDIGPGGSGMNALEEAQSLDGPSLEADKQPTTQIKKTPKPTPNITTKESNQESDQEEIPFHIPRHKIDLKKASIIAFVTLSIITAAYFLFRTRIIDAEITSVSWTHMVHVERYQQVHDAGFRESIPGDASEVSSMGERHHHYEKKFDHTEEYSCQKPCGEDCHTTPRNCSTTPKHCSSNKNGFKTCSGGNKVCTGGDRVCKTKYCSKTCTRDIYKDVSIRAIYYRWVVWRWKFDRTVIEEGKDNNPYWPSPAKVNLQNKERTSQSQDYTIWFTDADGNTHRYSPSSEEEFRTLLPGTKKKVKVRIIGPNEIIK